MKVEGNIKINFGDIDLVLREKFRLTCIGFDIDIIF